jgi:hypothetical protein
VREDGQRTGFVLGKTPGLGRILLWDDFEGLLRWSVHGPRLSPGVALSQALVFDGDWALRYFVGTRRPNGPSQTYCYRDVYCVPHGRIRLEIVWQRTSGGNAFSLGFGFWKWINGIQRRAAVRWAGGDAYWKYYDSNGDWQYLWDSEQHLEHDAWHRMALELDLARNEYLALESDGLRVNLSGIGFMAYGAALPASQSGFVLEGWIVGAGGYCYYDNALVRCI